MNEVKTFEFEGKSYKIIKPTNKIRRESDSIYAKAYREAIANGMYLEAEIEKILKERNLDKYSVEEQKRENEKKIEKLLNKLNATDNKKDGMEIISQIKELRRAFDEIDSARYELNAQSANLYAENKRFNFYAYACSSENGGEKIWSSYKEFEEDESELAMKAASEIMAFIYEGTQEILRQIEKLRPENEWLEKHGEKSEPIPVVEKAMESKTKKKKVSTK